ncbi:MAG: hypothetical protein EP330_31240 [Deltaproteobacteria bacterium]|nr:MAG: hypothetical protein EP330_31240 [Deltaproteobacteria bacterium]
MIRPPIMVWITGVCLLLAGLGSLAASGFHAFTLEEDGSYVPWVVLALAALVEMAMGLVVPIATRWASALGVLVAIGVGTVAVALGFIAGGGAISAAAVSSLPSFGGAFLGLITLVLVHQYRNELEG